MGHFAIAQALRASNMRLLVFGSLGLVDQFLLDGCHSA